MWSMVGHRGCGVLVPGMTVKDGSNSQPHIWQAQLARSMTTFLLTFV
jgi:hypothetical protein